MLYDILEVRKGHGGVMDSEGNYELDQIDFQVVLPWVPGDLPECLPGSRAVNATYMKDPLDASAVVYIKQHDGTWL